MKYFLSFCGLVLLVVSGRAALSPWAAETRAGSAVENALFRSMPLPDGPVVHLRPPKETREGLTALLNANATPQLYAIRAREEERAGDYTAAESDWKQAPISELADFYERRLEPGKEVAALLRIDSFERAVTVAQQALLPPAQIYEAWIKRTPTAVAPYQAYFNWAIQANNRKLAETIARQMKAAFPNDLELAIATDAALAGPAALSVYAKNFSPLWPERLRQKYFDELTHAHQLRAFLSEAQKAVAANPSDLSAVSKVFFYYEEQKRKPAADAELLRFVSRRKNWNPEELRIISALFLRVQDYDESARFSYQLGGATGLADVISLLLEVPEQPLGFVNRDLSLYKNIAGMDRHPGFLNGILSVALNTTDPEGQYTNASQTAVAYFHRAAASRLLNKLKTDFPSSPQIPDLQAQLFNAYALYGQNEALLREVPGWLAVNKNRASYVPTALLLADAFGRTNKIAGELALYDSLLQTLAEQSNHKPIGSGKAPQYAHVLDRYVSRLVELHRSPEALALLRREIDHNPDDAGLYERLALFVEQNHLDNDLEQTYRAALAHFKDTSWASKLARVYLRRKRSDAYAALSKQITDTFKGSELAAFMNDVPPNSPTLFRQVNLYAHSRFPHNMQFVKNLLRAYGTKATADASAYDKLLHENWCNDADLRTLYLQYLTRDGRLKTVLAALPRQEDALAANNPAALELRAGVETWMTQYESAAPTLLALATLAPGERSSNEQAISIERSLAPLVPGSFEKAVQLARQDVNAGPGDRAAIVRTGEIFADREQFQQSKAWWERAAAIRPGAEDGYLDSATVSWDYFRFDDALATINRARTRLKKASLFGYEAGAIEETQGRYKEAVQEYAQAALRDSSEQARRRLLTLAGRPGTRDFVNAQTAALVAAGFTPQALDLRVAVLEASSRRGDIQALLTRLIAAAGTTEETDVLRTTANRLGFDELAAESLQRTITLTQDPIEKLSARLDLAHYYEGHGNVAAAEREYNAVASDEPNRLGVVRAAVDYQWRARQWTKAVATLAAAADRAQQPYQNQLRREAAEKAASSGQYAEARRLLDRLLQGDEYNGDLLAEKASTYAREGDNAGLTTFYSEALSKMKGAPLTAADKTARIAALRRGYTLALTTAGRFTDALEQYQLVLNAYPEDVTLAAELSRFAATHQLEPRLTAYYEKATKDSPKDYRWPLVLARIQTTLGRLPAAIEAYDKAGYVRPDRSDIPIAKADLQMRLLRFTDVLKTYQKLYELSYHDHQYVAAQADVEARLGNRSEAIRLLRAAFIESHPEEPGGYVTAMQQTNRWQMFDSTDALFQELRPRLAKKPEWTRTAMEPEIAALGALHRPLDAVNLTIALFRDSERAAFLKMVASAAGRYLTPAERSSLGALPAPFLTGDNLEALGLRDLQAKFLLQHSAWQPLDKLQTRRLLFAELGRDLEALAPAHRRTPQIFQQIERQAFVAYERAGDVAAERRLINYSGNEYAKVFVSAGGDLNSRLYELAGQNAARANSVVQYLLANANEDVVRGAIEARGRRSSALWTNSYLALTGLYLDNASPWVQRSFASALGARTVAASLATQGAKNVLHGVDWYYYAGRFGAYLERQHNAESEDYRPAVLEAAPPTAVTFISLGDDFSEAKRWDEARRQYQYALELSPRDAVAFDRLGVIDVTTNHRDNALAQWRAALQSLAARVEQGPLQPEYWTTAQKLLTHINQFRAAAELRVEIDALFETYIKRNGTYEVRPLLSGLLANAADRRGALNRVIDWSKLPGAGGLLRELLDNSDLVSMADKDVLYQAQLKQATDSVNAAYGEARVQAQSEARQTDLEYIRYLQEQARWVDAWNRLQNLQPASERPPDLVLMGAAMTGHLTELLRSYEREPGTAATSEQMLSAAAALQKSGHSNLALEVEEFAYTREVKSGSDVAANYFGLARVRFAQKRTDEGLVLIRNVTLQVGAPFVNLPTAVTELESAGLSKGALRYASEWKTAEPWNREAVLTAARLGKDTKTVDSVRRANDVEYTVRLAAARSMRELGSPVSGSDELSLLTAKTISVRDANEPLAVESRLQAAGSTTDRKEKIRLYREAIAIDPDRSEVRWSLALTLLEDQQEDFGLVVFQTAATTPDAANDEIQRRTKQLAAEALVKREHYAQAVSLYSQLAASETDEARKAQLIKARREATVRQSLFVNNQSRRPVVSKDVTQHVLVRPKLVAAPSEEVASR